MGNLLGLFRRKKIVALTDQEILALDFDREVLSTLKRVSDKVEANFEVAPSDQEIISLAEETYDFCPDVVDQGTESIEELIKEMKESRKIILWWD